MGCTKKYTPLLPMSVCAGGRKLPAYLLKSLGAVKKCRQYPFSTSLNDKWCDAATKPERGFGKEEYNLLRSSTVLK